jgi:transcriptional regulator with XRE-family HTH domain
VLQDKFVLEHTEQYCGQAQVVSGLVLTENSCLRKNMETGYRPGVLDPAAFGRNLKALCSTRFPGKKKKEIAAELDVTPSMFSNWINEKGGVPEGETLLKLARRLRATIEDLVVGVDADYDILRRGKIPSKKTIRDQPGSGVKETPPAHQDRTKGGAIGDQDPARTLTAFSNDLRGFGNVVKDALDHFAREAEESFGGQAPGTRAPVPREDASHRKDRGQRPGHPKRKAGHR